MFNKKTRAFARKAVVTAACMALAVACAAATPVCTEAFAATTTYEAANTISGSGYVIVGAKGTYTTMVKKAVARVNEIRKEACDERINGLKPSDYVPIQWSTDMEQIARIRAAEASTDVSHYRPNGQLCFTVRAESGATSYSEVLAWNYSGIMQGIEQWYDEKSDLVNNTGGVTGHYESMIDPDYLSFAVVGFQTDGGIWPWTIAGEFSYGTASTNNIAASEDVVQKMQVKASELKVSIKGAATLAVGETASYKLQAYLTRDGYKSGPYTVDASSVTWKSSDSSVVTVSSGDLSALKLGKATLTANVGTKLTATKVVAVGPSAPSVTSLKAGKRSFTVKASVVSGDVDGIELSYKKAGGTWKTKAYTGASLSKKVTGLAKGKKYKVRVRSYKVADGKTWYSSWSSTQTVKVK